MNKNTKYFPHVDGLRAVAVLVVILNHYSETLVQSGYLGVDIFFVISGFVVSASLIKNRHSSSSRFLIEFYKRRFKMSPKSSTKKAEERIIN